MFHSARHITLNRIRGETHRQCHPPQQSGDSWVFSVSATVNCRRVRRFACFQMDFDRVDGIKSKKPRGAPDQDLMMLCNFEFLDSEILMDDSNMKPSKPAESARNDRIQRLFVEAMDLPEHARNEFIDRSSTNDESVAQELKDLLAAHAESTGDPPSSPGDAEFKSPGEALDSMNLQPGVMIGAFRIIEQIGIGGFGEVYLAEQTTPVHRKVALKIIKLGMDTRSVIARFEAERQALAMMDDSGIARVYEAGATREGRLYLVMEYVKGQSITEYCTRNRVNITDRLRLFIRVCEAIQHAHQKGIIHRDIKPANVLVSVDDSGRPNPKVIDFGIAKATDMPLTDKTIQTQEGVLIGTPQYMSPEQAKIGANDIDTRSDVYGLGALLYELLTDTGPFDPEVFRSADITEIQRVIREDSPPRPSSRIMEMTHADAARIAESCGMRSGEMHSMLRQELDWIPMKALRKQRSERYESCQALADDVGRFLSGAPLRAVPESRSYQVKKFVRRHRVPVTVFSVVMITLVAGIVGTSYFALQADQARARAERERNEARQEFERAEDVRSFFTKLFWWDTAGTTESSKELTNNSLILLCDEGIRRLDDAFTDLPDDQIIIRLSIASLYWTAGEEERSRAQIEIAREQIETTQGLTKRLELIYQTGRVYERIGDSPRALGQCLKILPEHRVSFGLKDRRTLRLLEMTAQVRAKMGQHRKALELCLESLPGHRSVLGTSANRTIELLILMGELHESLGEHTQAHHWFGEALLASQSSLEPSHERTRELQNRVDRPSGTHSSSGL